MLSSHKSESVKVIVRCRPFNQKEILNHCIRCVDIQQPEQKKNIYSTFTERHKLNWSVIIVLYYVHLALLFFLISFAQVPDL